MVLFIDPRIAAWGFTTFDSLFHHPQAVLVSGHPSRSVARLQIGPYRTFLKRQHWVPRKDYLASWWAGFGFVDRSVREWKTLLALRGHGIRVPEPLAVGSRDGRSFLLVGELEGAVDLHCFLTRRGHDWVLCTRLAERIAATLARLHQTGFTHPDLYAKHVFVNPQDLSIALIDFQRTMRCRRVSWRQRWRDLAALDASLGEHLAGNTLRLRLLRSYLHETGASHRWVQAVEAIRRRSRYLQRRRKVQAMRHPWQLVPGEQRIEQFRITVAAELVSGELP